MRPQPKSGSRANEAFFLNEEVKIKNLHSELVKHQINVYLPIQTCAHTYIHTHKSNNFPGYYTNFVSGVHHARILDDITLSTNMHRISSVLSNA
jgi:hypothetical protein